MTANKRGGLPWIVVRTEMFDDAKIRVIETLPDADTRLIIWVKLLCLAGRCYSAENEEGVVFVVEGVPFSLEQLAHQLGRPLNLVRLALQTFEHLRMISVEDDGIVRVLNWSKHQNVKGLREKRARDAERLRRWRENSQVGATAQAALPAHGDAGISQELAEKWGAVCDALRATSKLPSLTVEHLVMVDSEFPKARLSENFAQIVAEAAGVAGTVGTVLPWLRKVVSRLEERVEKAKTAKGDEW